jgi:FixJ family two-component response regulator
MARGGPNMMSLAITPVVTVVDNDAAVRTALVSLIRSAGWRARAFAAAHEFLACPRLLVPGCLVVDVALPDLDGLELQRRITDRVEMPIIFMTHLVDVPTTVRAMKAGAFDFMTKPFREDAMLSAIGAGIEHSCVTLSREADLLYLHERFASLSRRERQVMSLVVQGRMNKSIAAELGISEITVKAHRGKVMLKMRARSLAELVIISARLAAPAEATRPMHPNASLRTNVQPQLMWSAPRSSAYTKVLSSKSNRSCSGHLV